MSFKLILCSDRKKDKATHVYAYTLSFLPFRYFTCVFHIVGEREEDEEKKTEYIHFRQRCKLSKANALQKCHFTYDRLLKGLSSYHLILFFRIPTSNKIFFDEDEA